MIRISHFRAQARVAMVNGIDDPFVSAIVEVGAHELRQPPYAEFTVPPVRSRVPASTSIFGNGFARANRARWRPLR